MKSTLLKVFAFSCAMAAAAACNDNGASNASTDAANRRADATSPSTQAPDAKGQPITMTGCLQKAGTLGTLVLTQINEPSRPVGAAANGVGTSRFPS